MQSLSDSCAFTKNASATEEMVAEGQPYESQGTHGRFSSKHGLLPGVVGRATGTNHSVDGSLGHFWGPKKWTAVRIVGSSWQLRH